MIRINLLPVPRARRQEALIVQAVASVLIIVGTIAAGFFVSAQKNSAIAELQTQIESRKRDIEDLKAKVGEVERYKRQANQLQEQLGVIQALEKGRTGPVRVMDEFTDLIPRKVWISAFKENQKKISIDGFAESGEVIADFLDNLKTSKYFVGMQLNVVQMQEVDGQKLHKFSIQGSVKYDS